MEKTESKKNIVSFLHKATFVANLFFILCLIIRVTDYKPIQSLMGTTIILGWLMPPFLYIVSMFLFIITPNKKNIPVWLLLVNSLFFIFQIFFFLS